MISEQVLDSLRAAVVNAPGDVAIRLHLAQLLASAGRGDEAIRHAAAVLTQHPTNREAIDVIIGAGGGVAGGVAGGAPGASGRAPDGPDALPLTVERPSLRLSDVGGMSQVKARLEASLLGPLRNPELAAAYGKSTRGGLLLYGPPGCGKTFIARAVAGETGACFLPVSLADVLGKEDGQSEAKVKDLFATARANKPCVIFLDEVDALGGKRSEEHTADGRGPVNQLLAEMDGVGAGNDDVFVLGATNHPWDVDVALRRPGRFDRMLLVLPPDQEAREAVIAHHLSRRPTAGVNPAQLAERTDGYSGADLAYVCESAAEAALMDSARTGVPRKIVMADLLGALTEVHPSVGPWLDTAARKVAARPMGDTTYDDLLVYLRARWRQGVAART